jgi:hypothetical protein
VQAVVETAMVSKCANPACPAAFHYLGKGRLFLVESSAGIICEAVDVQLGHKPRRLEYFWLCDACCRSLEFVMENGTARLVQKAPEVRLRQTP